MNPHAPSREDLLAAQRVLGMAEVNFPVEPDPKTESGWAEAATVLLLLDLHGREDVVYHAMMDASPLAADGGTLQTCDPDREGTLAYLLTADFGDDIEPLQIAGLATQAAIAMFAGAEFLLLTDDARTTDDDTAPIFAIMPNDPIRWSYLLKPAIGSTEPDGDPPVSPISARPSWNPHRQAWLVHDPVSALWFEHRQSGWHVLDGLSDAS